MNPVQQSAFDAEMAQAKNLIAHGELAAAFPHLERAHVIGQAYVRPHVVTHWHMFRVEVRRRRPVAAFGQAVRMFLGGLGSAVGVIPVGNTGGSDISMFRRMPIAPDIQRIIDGRGDGRDDGKP